jgi:hypothetical protein
LAAADRFNRSKQSCREKGRKLVKQRLCADEARIHLCVVDVSRFTALARHIKRVGEREREEEQKRKRMPMGPSQIFRTVADRACHGAGRCYSYRRQRDCTAAIAVGNRVLDAITSPRE